MSLLFDLTSLCVYLNHRKVKWKIKQLKDTAALPPVTVLGMHDVLHMASERGDAEPNGRLYLSMSDGGHLYLPKQMESHSVIFTVPLGHEFAIAFDKQAFTGQDITYDRFDDGEDKNKIGIANTAKNNAVMAWLSSPDELRRIVRNYRELPVPGEQVDSAISPSDNSKSRKSKVKELLDLEERRILLQPLWDALQNCQAIDDNKLARLVELLRKHTVVNHKVIVFVRRYMTACYLEKALMRLLPTLSIGCTVREQGEKAELKSPGERDRIIQDFAPNANPNRRHKTDSYHILICTDADGIGLNMQDANVVINYDLPSSADLLFQRAGRVIRMTPDAERIVVVYTFLPEYSVGSTDLEKALRKLRNTMQERHEKSKEVVGGNILPPDSNPLVVPMACKEDILQLTRQFPMPEESLAGNAPSPDSHYAIYLYFPVTDASLRRL
jgi:hypothetical protein